MRNLLLAAVTALTLGTCGTAYAACPIPNPNNTPLSSGGFVDGCTLSAAGLNELGSIFSGAVGNHSAISPTPLAVISRMGDRLFVGKNTNVNAGGFSSQSGAKDWLETIRVNTTSEAIIAAISTDTLLGTGGGGISVLGAQRTSDQGTHVGEVEAVVGFCINDGAQPHSPSGDPGCWAGYFETRKLAIAAGTTNYGIEIDMRQEGSETIQPDPYGIEFPGGSIGLIVSSGAGFSGANAATAAIVVAQNPNTWNGGLVFQRQSVSGSDGTDAASCCANAIMMSREQAISFWSGSAITSVGAVAALLYSSVQTGHVGSNIEFINGGLQIENNATGAPLLAVFNTGVTSLGSLNFAGSNTPVGQSSEGQGAMTVNFNSGSNEVDLWNTNTGSTAGFYYYQMTGASAETLLMTLRLEGGKTALGGTWPTSCSGHSAGTLWNNSGVINVC